MSEREIGYIAGGEALLALQITYSGAYGRQLFNLSPDGVVTLADDLTLSEARVLIRELARYVRPKAPL